MTRQLSTVLLLVAAAAALFVSESSHAGQVLFFDDFQDEDPFGVDPDADPVIDTGAGNVGDSWNVTEPATSIYLVQDPASGGTNSPAAVADPGDQYLRVIHNATLGAGSAVGTLDGNGVTTANRKTQMSFDLWVTSVGTASASFATILNGYEGGNQIFSLVFYNSSAANRNLRYFDYIAGTYVDSPLTSGAFARDAWATMYLQLSLGDAGVTDLTLLLNNTYYTLTNGLDDASQFNSFEITTQVGSTFWYDNVEVVVPEPASLSLLALGGLLLARRRHR